MPWDLDRGGIQAGGRLMRGDTSPVSASASSPAPDETPERETSSAELLWDLVFVFAVTEVTTLLAALPSWGRFAQSMLVLALI
jgi:low temperature requirement protein LtrA